MVYLVSQTKMQNIEICIVREKLMCTVLIAPGRVYLDMEHTHTHIHHEFQMAELLIPL
jgi:hypothetical protein